jgi:phage terminase large subunit-like protein
MQAGIVHREAILMVDASPELSASLDVNRSSFNISYGETNSYYRALAADPAGQEGLNAHFLICDELRVWRGRGSWDALRYALRARRQGLLFAITTAGDDTTSVCYEQRQYSREVEAGTIEDDRHFSYIRCAEPADDWTSPETWHKANPSLGTIIQLDDFAADFREAEKTPTAQASFKRYSLNLWQSATTPWLDIHRWQACAAPFTADDLAGRECFGGLDLALKRDTTALALIFPWQQKPGGEWRYRLLSHFWLPRATAERQKSLIPWLTWEQQGYITITDGDVCDFNLVREHIREIAGRFNLQGLAYDRMFAHVLAQQLQDEDGIKMLEFPQTIMAFAEPTATFERLVIAGDIEHNTNRVMDWQIGNVNVKRDVNNNIRPVKPPDDEHRKIDGPVSAIMALGVAMRHEQDNISIYTRENRGFVTLG